MVILSEMIIIRNGESIIVCEQLLLNTVVFSRNSKRVWAAIKTVGKFFIRRIVKQPFLTGLCERSSFFSIVEDFLSYC